MIYILVFLSGFTGLLYQVLWMQQLGLLFGNTSHTAGATLAAFFAGLAVGSWVWGRRAQYMKNPLRVYAWLEVGIAVTALLYFGILSIFYKIYPVLYQGVDSDVILLLVKFALGLLLVFPPAFFMGGTIPVMGQHVIRNPAGFGKTSALLYAINTAGAALGAFLAGFYLPLWIGFNLTCAVAIAVTSSIAVTAFRVSRNTSMDLTPQADAVNIVEAKERTKGRWVILTLGFLSGFGVLALEVLWMRMFAQVLENSVYTYSAILVVVLICLASGSFLSSILARFSVRPNLVLAVLAALGGLSVSVTPFIFMHLTDSLQIIVSMESWSSYIILIFKTAFLTIALPALLLGTIFPFLMKAEERYSKSAGRSLGMLASVNTVGAILGSVICGFVFLGTLGMWRTMQVFSVLYLVVALLIPVGRGYTGITLKATCCFLLLIQFGGLDPTDLPLNSVDKLRGPEQILEIWEGSDCTVAVARNNQGLSIKINSHYGLGSTGAFMQEKIQADLPLMIYPETSSIFFLGMGTGITAGSALDARFSNITSIVTCELVPEVITAAKKYFTNVDGYDFTGGLFPDPRSTVLAEDGRHYIMASGRTFDMVNSDLFVPYRSGAGSLYSREHFESVKISLAPDGVFVQWLPLYQLTENEVYIIVRTMLEVFEQVSLWRSNFQPGEEVVALVGHKGGLPLPAAGNDSTEDKLLAVQGKGYRDLTELALPFDPATILLFYCGNVSASRDLFDGYPVNTDDRPMIEYMAPRTYRNREDAAVPWFVGPRIAKLADELLRRCPPADDPLLVNRTAENKRLPVAGAQYHWARIWQVIGDEIKCRDSWDRFVTEWTNGAVGNELEQ